MFRVGTGGNQASTHYEITKSAKINLQKLEEVGLGGSKNLQRGDSNQANNQLASPTDVAQ